MSLVFYPADLETDVVLRDGLTVRVRPVRDGDLPQVLTLLAGLSERSRYNRLMAIQSPDLEQARKIASSDYDTRMVLVAERGDRFCGLAGYYRDPGDRARAEVAFAVADSMQGHGLGTRMLERLAEIAIDRGVRAFDAYVLGDNLAMMDVFLQSGFTLTQKIDQGVFHVTLALEPSAAFETAAGKRAQLAAAASLRPFFEPRAIAVIGANREPGRIGSEVLRNLRDRGFSGTLAPVHPASDTIGGLKAYRTVKEIPFEVDLAIVIVPAKEVTAIVDDCIAKGVKALVVISAGFAEAGDAGAVLQAGLVERIRAAGVRLIGPNCMGIINTDARFALNATFSPVQPSEGRIAFSTQSGALGLAILDYVKRLNIGISSFASIGNKADVSGNDLLQYWAEDSRTDVILLYLESFGNPRKFAEIARRVGRIKPIVAVKAGHSGAGARAASSHTGARATSDVLVETMLRESGVIRAGTLEELFDVAAVLAHQPVPGGRRVAIVTNAGGPGILAADACEANGLLVPVLSEDAKRQLRAFLPAAASVANPIDLLASAPAEHYARALSIVAADPGIDSVIAIFIPPLVTQPEVVAAAIRESAGKTGKPILATFLGSQGLQPQLSPVPSFEFPEAAAAALAHVTRYGEWLRRPVPAPKPLAETVRVRTGEIVERPRREGHGWLPPDECDALLDAAGISSLRSRVARTPDDAVAAARECGFPAVIKAYGRDILHKSDVGGVRLGIASEAAVRDGFAGLAAHLKERFEGVIVQRMVTGGVEMVIGGVNDPAFGPVVMCGSGGVLVDVLDDTAFAMCPLSDAAAQALLEQVKGRVRLRGFRGAPPADEAAFVRVLVRVSELLDACPEIQELDLNPVMVLSAGVVVADVRVRVGSKPPVPAGRRIRY